NRCAWAIVLTLSVAPVNAQNSAVCGQSPGATATTPGELINQHPGRALQGFVCEEYHIWTSPIRRSNYDSHAVKKYVLPFVVIAAGLMASDKRTAEALPNTADQTRWSGRVSQLGAAYTLAGFSGGMFLVGKATKRKHAQETGLLALEALAHNQVVVFGVKQI